MSCNLVRITSDTFSSASTARRHALNSPPRQPCQSRYSSFYIFSFCQVQTHLNDLDGLEFDVRPAIPLSKLLHFFGAKKVDRGIEYSPLTKKFSTVPGG